MSIFHGSDVEKIAKAYQLDADRLINFGVNANPLGLSEITKEAIRQNIDLITRYPDPNYTSLKKSIANYLGIDAIRVMPSNGTSELIHRIIQSFAPKNALLYVPTYSEYAIEVNKQGGAILELPLDKENNFQFPGKLYRELISQADFVLICNPNNPTATLLSVSELLPLLEMAAARGIPFVIDETYIEFTENTEHYSAITFLEHFPNLIILRGYSKFFAAPGLRLGYGLFGNPEWIRSLTDSYPWAIHSLAAFAGEVILSDQDYLEATQKYIASERKRILRFLNNLPELTVYPTGINFFLVELHHHSSQDLFLFLLKQNLMIRSFYGEIGDGFFRFCILKEEQNTLLLNAIAEFLKAP